MGRKIAQKDHISDGCYKCKYPIYKGSVYYTEKLFRDDEELFFSSEFKVCARCNYYNEKHVARYEKFKETCIHPDKFIELIWSYIPGECVKQPDHDECRLCGKTLF